MNLVEVHFAEADKTVLVQPGTTLLAAAEMAGVDVMFGCTSTCSTGCELTGKPDPERN